MFQIAETKDGSHTLINTRLNQSYHSMHGALQESLHVFIKEGFQFYRKIFGGAQIRIFEMGYGTGLNAILTYLESKKSHVKTTYTAVELFPIGDHIAQTLNFHKILNIDPETIRRFHAFDQEGRTNIDPDFTVELHISPIEHFRTDKDSFNLIYFDAFSPTAQPELWTLEILSTCYDMLTAPGVWVTYSSKGDVRRALIEAGFSVEKIPGPPGKREMLRALKI